MEMGEAAGGGGRQPLLPPGFRFHPTDEELVVHYLRRKAASAPLPVSIIAEVDLYKHDPWELPSKASFGEHEWYFFSPRDRKYPNGARPNRAATSGYWKATGTDKPIRLAGAGRLLGVKKALVFYGGKPPKGVKTNWIMHEYRLPDGPKTAVESPAKKISLRLDDWVLCRIYQKQVSTRQAEGDGATAEPRHRSAMPAALLPFMGIATDVHKPASYNTMLAHEDAFYEGLLAAGGASFAVKPPELSLLLPNGSHALGLPGKVMDGEDGEDGCGQIGAYFHHQVMGTYHNVNWST